MSLEIFDSENDLLETLNKYDTFVKEFVNGEIDYDEFLKKYNGFYGYYALDGHESDEEELQLLNKYQDRIKIHETITFEILGKVCSDEDAKLNIYIDSGRYGPDIALRKIHKLIKNKIL